MDIHARDAYGMTALHKACLIGDWENATKMMKQGADPLLVDDEGRNAMVFARIMIKGFRHAAAESFATVGVSLAAADSLGSMSDREACDLGMQLFQRSLAAEGRQRSG